MDIDAAKKVLIEILQKVQRCNGQDPNVTGDKKPLRDMKGFDSKLIPVVTTMVGKKIGVRIPNDKNIFCSPDGKRVLTVNEVAAEVCKLVNSGATK